MILLLRYLANLFDTPQSRGKFGEMITASIFNDAYFGKEEHYIVNDLYFKTEDGKTHQIDHVVIYKTGIFCIETKYIDGLILGHPDVENWKVYIGRTPYDLHNPLWQNKGHVHVLTEFLGNKYKVNSVVVFAKGNKPKDCGSEVVNVHELKDYIKNYPCDEPLLSKEMQDIYALLTDVKDNSEISKQEHIDNVNNNK